jgi:hypothetical protein
MPDQSQEDSAAAAVLAALRKAGHQADIVQRPDRDDPRGPLTCDLVLRVDGTDIAVDIVRAAWPQPEMDAAGHWEKSISPALEEAATEAGVKCRVVAHPEYPNIRRAADRRRFLADAKLAMETAVQTGRAQVGETRIEVTEAAVSNGEEVRRVSVNRWARRDATVPLGDSVEEATGRTVRSKLRRQLAPARALDYNIGLIIDQTGDGDWLTSHHGYRETVKRAEEAEDVQLDACWLINGDRHVIDLEIRSLSEPF